MNRIGLDTSVVLRLLVGEPDRAAKRALELVKQCYAANVSLLVCDLVAAEAYHALIYHYDVGKKEAIETLRAFLSSSPVRCTGHALDILSEYDGKGAGFVDRMIRRDYLARCDRVVTFDNDFAKIENVCRVSDMRV